MLDIFLDRDGVINRNRPDHVKAWEEFEFLPGSVEALARLAGSKHRIFIITNQAIINRGIISLANLDSIHQRMLDSIEKAGGKIEAVLYCPHQADEACGCRKPQPGLLFQAQRKYGIQLENSWLIGDHLNDIEAGRRAGCRTMLVLTGRGVQSYQNYKKCPPEFSTYPLLTSTDLSEAVEIILQTEQRLPVLQVNPCITNAFSKIN